MFNSINQFMKLSTVFISILFLFLSCKHVNDKGSAVSIVAGSSRISGHIISPDGYKSDSIVVTITIAYPISGEIVRHNIFVDQSGQFLLDFDVETETSLIGLYSNINPHKTFFIKTKSNDSSRIDITYDSDLNIKNVQTTSSVNNYDIMQSMEVLNKMIDYRLNDPNWKHPHLYTKSIDEFLSLIKKNVSDRISQFIDKDNLFSTEFKSFMSKDYSLFIYTGHVFNYESEMLRNYRKVTQDRDGAPKIKKIDRSYFRFLKDFNLNDPQYLHAFTFSEFQDSILQNEVLKLPKIGETDITLWLNEVKAILANLVGFDSGQYYDILTANAYAQQLNEEIRSLSEKQKENIIQYWGNGEIAKILLRKNQKVIEMEKIKSPTVVHDISSISKEQVIDALLTKYKNKVVFIDLWATWCGPCLDAMKQFSSIKGGFLDEDIVFVYITNSSSPKRLWEEKIKGIGSEHYYLTADQWGYIMDEFQFEYIPSYLLFNKDHDLVDKFSSFPSNSILKMKINDLLN